MPAAAPRDGKPAEYKGFRGFGGGLRVRFRPGKAPGGTGGLPDQICILIEELKGIDTKLPVLYNKQYMA